MGNKQFTIHITVNAQTGLLKELHHVSSYFLLFL
jgi:hypothetical protein